MTESLDWTALWDKDEQRYRVQTRNGASVRIFTINGREPCFPVVGEIYLLDEECFQVFTWTNEGQVEVAEATPFDLIPEPRTVRRWANVYRNQGIDDYKLGAISLYKEREEAERRILNCESEYVTTVPIEWKE